MCGPVAPCGIRCDVDVVLGMQMYLCGCVCVSVYVGWVRRGVALQVFLYGICSASSASAALSRSC